MHSEYVAAVLYLGPAQELLFWNQVVLSLHFLAGRLVLVRRRRMSRRHRGGNRAGRLRHRGSGYKP